MGQYKRSFFGVVGGLIGIVAMSAVAGLLITVAITPALAISGVATRTTINTFENLPNYLAIDELSQVSKIYATLNDGTHYELASFYDQNRIEVPLQATSQFVRDAVVAGEDPRFYEHGGIDVQGTLRAAAARVTGGPTSGGSSVTQQYVKNVLVQKCEVMPDPVELQACFQEATDPTEARKLKEMRLAIGVEKQYSKDDILQGYLNITGYGGTVYGIEAASRYYYNTSSGTLTLPQAASLIAIVNNPEKFRLDMPASETNGAANGYADNKSRRDYILSEMLQYEKITPEQHAEAIASPIEPTITEPSTGCATAGGAAFFCDYVTHVLRNDPTFGEDADARMLNFRRGGYEIYTTLDLDLQAASENAINTQVPMTASWDVGAVATSVQVGTGRVVSMAQNKKYTQLEEAPGPEYTGVNYNTNFNEGGSTGFQPGSTYKVFTLAEWLTEGHALGERVDSSVKPYWGTFQDSCLGSYSEQFPLKNDAGESGTNYSALESTINSYNTGFMGMAKKLDLCGIKNTAQSFGIVRADGAELFQTPATVLGTNEVAPLNMAVAFAGIANKGTTCSPVVIDKIMNSDDVEIPAPKSTCTASVTPDVAAGMAYAMERVLTGGSARESNNNTFPRVPMIGKTGTTDKSLATWMSGASSKIATVVGVVNVQGFQSQRSSSANLFGKSAATARHRMWPMIMSAANAKYGGDEFDAASNTIVQGRQVAVPDVRGLSLGDARSKIEAEGFAFSDGGIVDSELPTGTIARSEPASGNTASTGSLVTVYTSNGSQVLLPDVVGQSVADAKQILSGFTLDATLTEPVTDPSKVGKITVMNPVSGTPAIPGGTVFAVVGVEAPAGSNPSPTATPPPG
jgi:membrane peptidoglycan carboxypeptidase